MNDYPGSVYTQSPYMADQSYDPTGWGSGRVRRFNGLELLVVVFSLLVMVMVFVWGLVSANTANRDSQRQQDIAQVITALRGYYQNSNTVPSNRAYPVAVCSGDLNEVDFELTLRQHLTGLIPEKDPHAYIAPENFPRDRWGRYHSRFADRPIPFRCPGILPSGPQTAAYADDYPSCIFSSQRRMNTCYLYASSSNGDTYQIGYYSEQAGNFVVYSQFREEPIRRLQ